MSLPPYLNCESAEVTHCDFYMHNDCPRSCAYAIDIGAGIGAVCDGGLIKRINENRK